MSKKKFGKLKPGDTFRELPDKYGLRFPDVITKICPTKAGNVIMNARIGRVLIRFEDSDEIETT